MEKLQAGIFSGQTKPLRSLGLDKIMSHRIAIYDRKLGEPTQVGCDNHNYMLAA